MRKKVLVVDDSKTVRLQLRLALEPAGYEVLDAFDGRDGVKQVEAVKDLAIVICDVNMPEMNGIQMISSVKADGRHAELPILLLTTEGQASLMAQAKAAGAKAWIVKPFKTDLLLATVRKLIGE